jgi:hypothetical protein
MSKTMARQNHNLPGSVTISSQYQPSSTFLIAKNPSPHYPMKGKLAIVSISVAWGQIQQQFAAGANR